eukprot:COSAG01_NODE_5116_length_4457_cov_5.704161_3_plen_174_part_00
MRARMRCSSRSASLCSVIDSYTSPPTPSRCVRSISISRPEVVRAKRCPSSSPPAAAAAAAGSSRLEGDQPPPRYDAPRPHEAQHLLRDLGQHLLCQAGGAGVAEVSVRHELDDVALHQPPRACAAQRLVVGVQDVHRIEVGVAHAHLQSPPPPPHMAISSPNAQSPRAVVGSG